MAGETVYADLNLSHSFPGSRAPLSALPLSPQSPRWNRTALWVSGIGNIVLAMAVIALGIWVSHLVSEKGQTLATLRSGRVGSRDAATAPGTNGAGSRDAATAACSAHLERVRSQLCPPAQPGPAGGAGCKLCPADWRQHGDTCYWVSTGMKTWNESRSNCAARGSQLLVFRAPKELAALKDMIQAPAQFWVGLSCPSLEKAWTWLDGSRLDQTLRPVSGPAEGSSCGVLKGNRFHSEGCSSTFQWVCQRDTVQL